MEQRRAVFQPPWERFSETLILVSARPPVPLLEPDALDVFIAAPGLFPGSREAALAAEQVIRLTLDSYPLIQRVARRVLMHRGSDIRPEDDTD